MRPPLTSDWGPVIAPFWSSSQGKTLKTKVADAYANHTCYPPLGKIWKAYELCSHEQVKVVILGQDPYHQVRQAHGLAFSVPGDIPLPPSLRNIFKEITTDLHITPQPSGNLERWAQQGVLLLNTSLTVTASQPGSHANWGWETLTDNIIKYVDQKSNPVVFMLWGNAAIAKRSYIDSARHLVLTAPHPSPLSAYRGWFGCKHFSQANTFLQSHGQTPIDWS